MKNLKLLFILLLVLQQLLVKAESIKFSFNKSTIIAADSLDGAVRLGENDGYANYFSLFDIQSKTDDISKTRKDDYYEHARKQSLNWTQKEIADLKAAFAEVLDSLNKKGIVLSLPAKIYVIKSTLKEEYGASGYTRGNNIVLNTASEGINAHLVSHELFHVYSRHNPAKKDKLYSVFGFKKCNKIALNGALDNLNITNPDCPEIAHYVSMGNEDVTLLLYSAKKYEGGNVFETYVRLGVLVLEGSGDNKKIKIQDGKAVIKTFEEVPELFQIIGMNTDYVLHPEEIAAEHFSMIVTGTVPRQPELLAKYYSVLKAAD
jgi:hypothetical protein